MSLADAERILLERIYQVLGPYPTDPTGWPSSDRVEAFGGERDDRLLTALCRHQHPRLEGRRAAPARAGALRGPSSVVHDEMVSHEDRQYVAKNPHGYCGSRRHRREMPDRAGLMNR